MNTFTESGFEFSFANRWQVIRYDQHRFYNYLSGYGLKGVDFIAIDLKTRQLWLMEVKNFAPTNWQGESPTMDLVLSSPENYAEEMIAKFTDSLRLLKVIHDFYQKKWWHRLLSPLFKKILPLSYAAKFDFIFWPQAYQIVLHHAREVNLSLFIEWRTSVKNKQIELFNEVLSQKLKEAFKKEGFLFTLASTEQVPAGMTIRPKEMK